MYKNDLNLKVALYARAGHLLSVSAQKVGKDAVDMSGRSMKHKGRVSKRPERRTSGQVTSEDS